MFLIPKNLLNYSTTYDLIVFLTLITATFVLYLNWKLSYWSRKGIPILSPSLLFGDAPKLLLGELSTADQFAEFYTRLKSKKLRHGGVYVGPQAFYVPIDPEICKEIMQGSFQNFTNHGTYIDELNDPLSGHLFNLENSKWKDTRIKLTPAFTSAKMRMMFQTMLDCNVHLLEIFNTFQKKSTPLEVKDVFTRFTTDVIASCAFGFECNSLENPEVEFRKFGKIFLGTEFIDRLKFVIQLTIPRKILSLLKYRFTRLEVEKFLLKIVKKEVDHREQNKIYRKDFLHLLLQLRNRGTVADDKDITDQKRHLEKYLSLQEIVAHVFIFFLAGFETSAATMSFATYEVAINSPIQEKLRSEIKTVLKKYNNTLSYDAINEMTYLSNVVNETMRKYPPVPIIPRICTKNFPIPDTNILLEKDSLVLISTSGLHKDPDYYPNPDLFHPDRFLDDNVKARPQFTFLPFGEGPRKCIGYRFGLLQIKIGLITVLNNFKIKISQKTKIPLKLDAKSFITTPEGGIWIDLEAINEEKN